jgi:ABC-2 type transport system permease protein
LRTLRFLLEKEFRQIFRDPAILRIIFIMPLVQLLVLPLAADYEMKNIRLTVVDHDHSPYSRRLVGKITSSGYFLLQGYNASFPRAMNDVEQDVADLVLEIPAAFESNLIRENENTLFVAVNAINGTKGGLGAAYLQQIIQAFNGEIRTEWIQLPRYQPEPVVEVVSANWFNPSMNYHLFMVPGILVVLITVVGAFLSSLNIVKEKEIGTIEQINVTPIRKYHFILGKLIPFWILGLVVLTLGLLIARLAYGVIPVGNLGVIYVFAALYLFAVLGLGLLVSTYTANQQQAMLISFFMMMIFILLGGLYTPIDSMPRWAQYLTMANPVSYFIEVMRMVILKGSGLSDISRHIWITLGFGLLFNGWAILNYRKRS